MSFNHAFHHYSMELGYTHYANCTGVVSRFKNTGLQAIFADFDTGPVSQAGNYEPKTLQEIEDDLAEGASNVPGLGSFFIFESSPNHFHAIDFSLHDLLTTRRFLSGLKYVDHKYVSGLIRKGENTIRISEKLNDKKHRPIRFVKFMKREAGPLVHHNGLVQLYERLYPEIRAHTLGLVRDGSTHDDLYILNYKTIVW